MSLVWQSVLLDLCAGVLRMTLLRCPKFLRCLTADAGNFDRGHSLTSLPLPPAALGSLPTTSVRTGLGMTGCKECLGSGRCRHRPLRKSNKRCGEAGDRKGRPYGGFPDRTSQGLPTPFLHISCSLRVDFLWINFPSPFLPPSCGNSSFPLWKKNLCISRPYGGFPQKFSLRLLLLKNT